MSKTVVIHQPDFMPYLGFFQRFLMADLWVVLDDVQYVRNHFHNRDKIKTPDGAKWITVGVQKNKQLTNINQVYLATTNWRNANLNLIKANYGKSPFWNEIYPHIEELYKYKCEKMIDFNLKSIFIISKLFGIKIDLLFSSTLAYEGKKNQLLVDILKKVKASTYLSGVGAKDYFDPKPFDDAAIKIIWQDFVHPEYPQLHGDFNPYLSSIDLLFNCGIEESRKILRVNS